MIRNSLRSWWIVLALVSWLNWTAFVYAGLRIKHRPWLKWAAVYFLFSAASLVLILGPDPTGPADTWYEQLGAWLGILSWGVVSCTR